MRRLQSMGTILTGSRLRVCWRKCMIVDKIESVTVFNRLTGEKLDIKLECTVLDEYRRLDEVVKQLKQSGGDMPSENTD